METKKITEYLTEYVEETLHFSEVETYFKSLSLVKPQQSLALLEDDFLRPASGVDSICFKESQAKVCGKQSAPWASLASADEEQP